jgi:hypothetical protein
MGAMNRGAVMGDRESDPLNAAADDAEPDRSWVDMLPADVPVHLPPGSDSTWHVGRPGRRAQRLRSTAVTVWFAWLVAAGVIVGGTLLVVLARVAAVVLRWAVGA